jgi:hypothetical protein
VVGVLTRGRVTPTNGRFNVHRLSSWAQAAEVLYNLYMLHSDHCDPMEHEAEVALEIDGHMRERPVPLLDFVVPYFTLIARGGSIPATFKSVLEQTSLGERIAGQRSRELVVTETVMGLRQGRLYLECRPTSWS